MDKVVKSVSKAGESSLKTAEPVYKAGKSTLEESKNWKSKLTAALDDTTLLISLAILGFFYFVYTITNYGLGGNTRDQDSITSGCSCRDSARHLYRLWFSLSFIAWFFAYSYVPIQRACQAISYCLPGWKKAWCLRKYGDFLEAARKVSFWKGLYYAYWEESEDSSTTKSTTAEPEPTHNKSSHRKELWYKYYKLYVMGYVEEIKPPSPTPAPADSNTKNSNCPRNCDRPTEVYSCCCPNCKCWHILCSSHLVNWLRGFILFIKYIAQLATVPLLMVQMFDTYALLCFAPNHRYCGDRSEYEIHLTQVAITMSFYIAIAVAQITTTVLEWDPIVSFDQLQKKRENAA